MTGRAIRAELTIVFVIPLMAGKTVCRRAFELLVDMAGLASYFRMLALQLERREIVVKRGGCPAVCCVTVRTVKPKAASVRLIVMVTGIAIL